MKLSMSGGLNLGDSRMGIKDLEAQRAIDARKRELESKIEDQIKNPPQTGGVSVEQALDNAKALEDKLVPGARTRTPRARMLEAPEAVAKNPDKVLRWGNMRDPEKMETHKMDGYARLTSEEGGKQLGNELVLLGIPKKLAEERVAEQKQRTAELMQAHTRTMEGVAESVARQLRDRHGISVDASRILVNEEG